MAKAEGKTTSKAEHTPGPWEVEESRSMIAVVARGGRNEVAQINMVEAGVNANARLIAAAPRMRHNLEALIESNHTDADGDCVLCGERVNALSIGHAKECPVAEARAILRDVEG